MPHADRQESPSEAVVVVSSARQRRRQSKSQEGRGKTVPKFSPLPSSESADAVAKWSEKTDVGPKVGDVGHCGLGQRNPVERTDCGGCTKVESIDWNTVESTDIGDPTTDVGDSDRRINGSKCTSGNGSDTNLQVDHEVDDFYTLLDSTLHLSDMEVPPSAPACQQVHSPNDDTCDLGSKIAAAGGRAELPSGRLAERVKALRL